MIPTVALWRAPRLGLQWKPALRQAQNQDVAAAPVESTSLEAYGEQLLRRGLYFGFGGVGGLAIMALINIIAPKSLGAYPGFKSAYMREAALTAVFGAVTAFVPIRSVTLDALTMAWGTFTGASLGNGAYSAAPRRRTA